MSLRFHEIAAAHHTVQNPLNLEKLRLLGDICSLKEGQRVLDLGCGKGAMLVNWAYDHHILGVGVDQSSPFIEDAKQHAHRQDVGNKVNFVVDDPAVYPESHHQFDVIVAMGALNIGGSLAGTLNLMQTALKSSEGLLVVGQSYWNDEPPDAVYKALDIQVDTFATLDVTLDRIQSAGFEVIEMVMADQNEWDRYEAGQWMAVHQYLNENHDDPINDGLKQWRADNQRRYLRYGRRYLGWGVFVLHSTPSVQVVLPSIQTERPVGLDIVDGMLWVRLGDGRVIGNPLAWYPWLEHATQAQAENLELTTWGIEWPDLRQWIEVRGMLKGRY